jgi:uncharacterized GH25 family protein
MNAAARIVLISMIGALASGTAAAHEMFLRAESAFQTPNADQVIRLINGTFDKSENGVERDRMAKVSIVGNGRATAPATSAWYDDADSSYLKYRTGESGTYVVGVSTKPKMITMSSADFVAYLKHDGVTDTLATFGKTNKLAQVRERYSKHVRALLQVGDRRTDDFGKPLGFPIEILLDQNPYSLKFGQEISFRVLLNGKPLANQLVRASYEGFHGHDAKGGHINAREMRTDKDGRARFLLTTKSLWYVSLIQMQRLSADPEADYESNWATLTFLVR